ncbi:MAG: DUF2927 domain-containing protein [Pseudomonadota bacterium]
MIRWLALFLLIPALAQAQDYVTSEGRLSDEDFYKTVACSAPVGGACVDPIVRWAPADATDLTIGITETRAGFPESTKPHVKEAIRAAIKEINGAGAALRLRFVAADEDPHITVHLWDQGEGDTIRGMGLKQANGSILGAAYVHIWWNGDKELTRGVIIVARDIEKDDLRSVMLEEITQAMGLLTDIDNPWYDTRSILSENTNWVIALQPQDKMALRRHYPHP